MPNASQLDGAAILHTKWFFCVRCQCCVTWGQLGWVRRFWSYSLCPRAERMEEVRAHPVLQKRNRGKTLCPGSCSISVSWGVCLIEVS